MANKPLVLNVRDVEKTPRSKRKKYSTSQVMEWAKELRSVKNMQKTMGDRYSVIRDRLLDALEELGEADETGSYHYTLPEEVDGTIGLKRERRPKPNLNREALTALLKSIGVSSASGSPERVPMKESDSTLFEHATNVVVVLPALSDKQRDVLVEALPEVGIDNFEVERHLSDELVNAAIFRGLLSEKEFGECVEVTEGWALVENKR